ncbi:endonuclease domain-containing protein [Sphingomonas sp. LHG3406-1]|uniref:endonuclease domain-containing protein n=1 Tax=Sphingomonas sp. LHG3406-1 TaxID=2804617 RepID=UPI0026284205|nr:endonuclease domain-containing protein [Sphingomonas sp. LHG3406-1]
MRATANAMYAARRYRGHLSLPEQLFWRLLRQARRDLRFRRQHPIGPYVADFYCAAAKMVIEIDGASHNHSQAADERRTAYLHSVGLQVLRIPAADVLANPEAVADALMRRCERRAGPSTTQPEG